MSSRCPVSRALLLLRGQGADNEFLFIKKWHCAVVGTRPNARDACRRCCAPPAQRRARQCRWRVPHSRLKKRDAGGHADHYAASAKACCFVCEMPAEVTCRRMLTPTATAAPWAKAAVGDGRRRGRKTRPPGRTAATPRPPCRPHTARQLLRCQRQRRRRQAPRQSRQRRKRRPRGQLALMWRPHTLRPRRQRRCRPRMLRRRRQKAAAAPQKTEAAPAVASGTGAPAARAPHPPPRRQQRRCQSPAARRAWHATSATTATGAAAGDAPDHNAAAGGVGEHARCHAAAPMDRARRGGDVAAAAGAPASRRAPDRYWRAHAPAPGRRTRGR